MGFRSIRHVQRGKEHWASGLVLLLALIQALVYVFLLPPWQHYDEPGHFEFAWLIANREKLPEPGDYDQSMRRELAASMIEYDFFRGMNYRSNLLSQNEPIWIGVPQITPLSLYHRIISIPLRFIRSSDLVFQLYFGRMVSVVFYLITIVAAWGIVVELTPKHHPLRWMVPLTLVFLPGFSDIMTAVNDDVGATVFFSLFLWASVRMMQRGFSSFRLVGVIGAALLCFSTKNTVTLALPLVFFPVLFSLLRGPHMKLAWIMLIIGLAVVTISLFSWGDAARWLRQTNQLQLTRARVEDAPLGSHAFRLISSPAARQPQAVQILPDRLWQQLSGKTITIGAWIWSNQAVLARTPVLQDANQIAYQDVTIGPEPKFYAFTTTVNNQPNRLRLTLDPVIVEPETEVIFYYDGVILAEGEYPITDSPTFNHGNGAMGAWGGQPFSNLVQNASAESSWPSIRPWVNRVIGDHFPGELSMILAALLDWAPASWYYKATSANIFYTFWGKLGWGHINLIAYHPYRLLAGVTLIGMLGAAGTLWRFHRRPPWDILTFMGISLLGVWGPAFFRGISSLTGEIFIPSARYAFPAIIPAALILNVGWLEIFRQGECRLRLPQSAKWIVFSFFFLTLDIIAIVSIARYYG